VARSCRTNVSFSILL